MERVDPHEGYASWAQGAVKIVSKDIDPEKVILFGNEVGAIIKTGNCELVLIQLPENRGQHLYPVDGLTEALSITWDLFHQRKTL